MRLLFIFAMLAAVLNFTTARSNFGTDLEEPRMSKSYKPTEALWFTQQLNHFNPADVRVWKQKYYVNDEFYKPKGPIFLYIGAEAPVSDRWIHAGQMFDEAKRFGAKMFILEHRFYGSSQPTTNLSVENLAYLNTEQALFDLAYFIEGMNEAHGITKDTKWIVFGCSYAGSLAAWVRAKFPHLVHGAVSSSAPLLAKLDFPEYVVVMEESLKTHSQACVDAISSATSEIGKMLEDPVGQQKLEKLFNLCDPVDSRKTTKNDISNFYQMIVDFFASIIQYNKNNRGGNIMTIDTICEVLVDEKKGAPINRLAQLTNLALRNTKEKCLDYKYDKMIEELRNVTKTNGNHDAGRQWMYQTCTEFGFYQTSSARPNLFSDNFPLDFYLQQCVDIFGPQFEALAKSGVKRTNRIFGAFDLENLVSNILFVHGTIDPWYPLGITKSNNPNAPSIFINGTAHCANIYPARRNDLPELVEARKQTTRLIDQWLGD